MKSSVRLIQPILALACAVVTIMSCDDRTGPLDNLIAPTGSGSGAPTVASGIPRWDASPYGITGVRYDPGQEVAGDAVIDSLAANGASGQWVRLTFYWNEIWRNHPYWPDTWYPHGFIEPVTRFKRHGIKIFGTLEGTAFWATKYFGKDPHYGRRPPDSLDLWRQYVQAVVDSFPSVDAWGIWNEPNDTNFFRPPDGQDPALEYARMVAIAAPIIHAAHKPLVVGEIAWSPSTLGAGKTDRDMRDWVARMMRHVTVTFGQTVEVLAVHHYGTPADNVRVPEVSLPQMYAENPDLPWANWEVWMTEFANAQGYNDESTTADDDIAKQLSDVFGAVTSPYKLNKQWTKAFYFNLADADGGRRNLVGNWEIARAQNNSALLRFRSPFSIYNRLSAAATSHAAQR